MQCSLSDLINEHCLLSLPVAQKERGREEAQTVYTGYSECTFYLL